ncbi:MAG: nuclear transport factor 2 family protein [Acidimicrobiales bacterium]|nr:nuclear transport factor 2 family protein [Acidimicrobiales bacterium]
MTYPDSLDHMLAAWNEPDPKRVRSHLEAALADDVEFIDPSVEAHGIDEFEANVHRVQHQIPGATYERSSGVDSHHQLHRYSWRIRRDGETLLDGFDVTETDEQGRIHRVLGFFGSLPDREEEQDFVPADFQVPTALDGPGFRLEPLGPEHNERDHEAWMSSIDHIWSTPDFPNGTWPTAMSLESNLADLERHALDFASRKGFTYSVLDGDDVVGCVYIYPAETADADVSSWVRANRAELDIELWQAVSEWLETDWPFTRVNYGAR